jgi:hypothetical protein
VTSELTPTPEFSPTPSPTPTEESFRAAADPIVITMTPSTNPAGVGTSVTVAVSLSGTLTDTGGTPIPNGTVYLSALWPFQGGVSGVQNLPSACTRGFAGPTAEIYWWFDVQCTVGSEGEFDYSFSITGTALADPAAYEIHGTLWQDEFLGRRLTAENATLARFTVGSIPPGGTYAIEVNPETLTVAGDSTVTFDLSVSGILADASGIPIDGAVYLESYWPFAGGAVYGDATGDCVRDLAYGGFVTMVCQTNANGEFSGTIRVSGTAPSNEGDHAINAVLTETDASGRTLLPNTWVATLTIDNSDNVSLSILPSTITVSTVQQIDYRVIVDGTTGTGAGTPLQLTIEVPFEANLGAPWCNTALTCEISSNTWNPATETRTVVLDIVSGTGGSVDLTFHFLAVPPQEPGTYPLSAEFSRSGGTEPIDSATGSITVTEPPPVESYVLTVDPVDSTVEAGAEVTYEFTLTGRLVTNGEPVPHGTLNLELDLPFTLLDFVEDGQVPGCGLIHGIPERVTCPTSADGTFAHTFTMSGTAPETVGSLPMVAELRETSGSGRILIASSTIATLTTEESSPTPSPTTEPSPTPSPTTEPSPTAEPETGSITVTISTADGGDIPSSAEICVGDVCTTISEIEASGLTAADLPSGSEVVLVGIPIGTQRVSVTGAAPYLDYSGSVGIIAGQSIPFAIVLQPVDDPTPTATNAPATPTATSEPGDPDVPTATPTQPANDTDTPSATEPSGEGDDPDQPIDTLPSTGTNTGSPGTSTLILLIVAFAVTAAGLAGWQRRSRG